MSPRRLRVDKRTEALFARIVSLAEVEALGLDPRRLRDRLPDPLAASVVGKLDAITRSADTGFFLVKANL